MLLMEDAWENDMPQRMYDVPSSSEVDGSVPGLEHRQDPADRKHSRAKFIRQLLRGHLRVDAVLGGQKASNVRGEHNQLSTRTAFESKVAKMRKVERPCAQ